MEETSAPNPRYEGMSDRAKEHFQSFAEDRVKLAKHLGISVRQLTAIMRRGDPLPRPKEP